MNPRPNRSQRGWTFVEMLVAVSLSAIFMGAATLVFSSISANSKRLTTVVDANIGATAKMNFYGESGESVSVYTAPNYGKSAFAQDFRDLILEDSDYASAIHCLPRSAPNTIRPEFLDYPAGAPDSPLERPRLDTPEAFRLFLAKAIPASAAIYDSPIRNVPSTSKPNTSVFILAPETDPKFIRVRAVYEIDFITPSNLSGTYASVRRYRNGALTHYYDIFYESGPGGPDPGGPDPGGPLTPGFVAFERSARKAVTEGTGIDRFKISDWNPFYFLWLPDPAINPHRVANLPPTAPSDSPSAAYEQMGAKTSLLLVLPTFPGL